MIETGTRIRITFLEVRYDDDTTKRVVLKHAWTGPIPEHMCSASSCANCLYHAVQLAVRGSGKSVVAMKLLHDGQSVAR